MKRILRLASLLLCPLLLCSCGASGPLRIAEPDIPDVPQYPFRGDMAMLFSHDKAYDAWAADVDARAAIAVDTAAVAPFAASAAVHLLRGSNGANRVCSPISLYIALGMLAETTGGDTQAEILALLGCDDLNALRQSGSDLWNATYRNDGTVTRTMATSMWLNETIPYQRETVNNVAEHYYASVYRGRMGSGELNSALQRWLNENTMDLLSEQTASIQLPPETALALASAISFSARWDAGFYDGKNTTSVFHAPAGDMNCTFMNRSANDTLYWGEHFQAVSLSFDMDGGVMWLILPDEGFTPDDLLADEDCLTLITTGECPDSRQMYINLSVPKFDVTSQLELSAALRDLGLIRVFDPASADFTPLTNADLPIALGHVQHDARVVIDEEGCKAAAYTVMLLAGAAPPQQLEEIDFVLDRPFLFTITGAGGLPLFAGVVNDP